LEKLPNPLDMQYYHAEHNSRSGGTLTEEQEDSIRCALDILSDQERAAYVMARAYCIPFSDIANAMAISKGSVQDYIKRAEAKLKRGYHTTLNLWGSVG
jgi:DNA-directed RNA polymerase specialized sigma24 family protein